PGTPSSRAARPSVDLDVAMRRPPRQAHPGMKRAEMISVGGLVLVAIVAMGLVVVAVVVWQAERSTSVAATSSQVAQPGVVSSPPAVVPPPMPPRGTASDQGTFIKQAVFADGRLWLLNASGNLSTISPGVPQRNDAGVKGVLDLCRREDAPIVVAC